MASYMKNIFLNVILLLWFGLLAYLPDLGNKVLIVLITTG